MFYLHILDFFCTFVGEMKEKKSANSKVPSRALHAKSRKDSCTNNVHPDVILDADEALRNILGRLTLKTPVKSSLLHKIGCGSEK